MSSLISRNIPRNLLKRCYLIPEKCAENTSILVFLEMFGSYVVAMVEKLIRYITLSY